MSEVVSALIKLLLALLAAAVYFEVTRHRAKDSRLHRPRRHSFAPVLVYPSGTVFQINIALQNPVPVPNKTVAISMGLQFNFVMPTNVSEFRQTTRPKRAAVGWALPSLEALLDEYGFQGRPCVLRSVCEAAQASFRHEDSDLLEEVAHILLTPSEEDVIENFDCGGNISAVRHLDEGGAYLVAECAGKAGHDCSSVFAECPESPLDLISHTFISDYLEY